MRDRNKYMWSAYDRSQPRAPSTWLVAGVMLAIFLMALFGVRDAWAQSNPTGVSTTDATTSGFTFIFTGGTRPLTIYRKPPAGTVWQTYRTNVGNFSDILVINDHIPGQCFDYTFTGAGVTGGASSGSPTVLGCAQSLPPPFNDVPGTYWALTEIYWMRDNNITSGCGNGNYCPELTVTRAQMAVFLYNVWQRCVEQNACQEPVIPQN